MMATTYININGEVREASSLQMPSTGREFRGAWQFNGDVIEVDMVKARDLKVEKIIQKANERIAKAEQKAREKALKALDDTEEQDELSKFKAKPKSAGIDLIANAPTPDDLDAITEDDVFA